MAYYCLVTKSGPAQGHVPKPGQLFCDPMDCSPPGFSVMEFPKQEYWNGLPFHSLEDFPNPGIKPASPALAGEFCTTDSPGKCHISC